MSSKNFKLEPNKTWGGNSSSIWLIECDISRLVAFAFNLEFSEEILH